MCKNYIIIIFITSLRHITSLPACHLIFFNFLFTTKKKKNKKFRQSIIFVSYCIFLKVWKFGRISTVLNFFTAAYLIVVAKFLSFIVKSFLACLVSILSMMENWRKNTSFFIAACKNDTKTKIHQYSLTDRHYVSQCIVSTLD